MRQADKAKLEAFTGHQSQAFSFGLSAAITSSRALCKGSGLKARLSINKVGHGVRAAPAISSMPSPNVRRLDSSWEDHRPSIRFALKPLFSFTRLFQLFRISFLFAFLFHFFRFVLSSTSSSSPSFFSFFSLVLHFSVVSSSLSYFLFLLILHLLFSFSSSSSSFSHLLGRNGNNIQHGWEASKFY